MLKHRNLIPLDYSLCAMTVTVYGPEGSRRVLNNVHYEYKDTRHTAGGKAEAGREFLLVIPGEDPIAPGHKVLLGIGPERIAWGQLNPTMPTLGTVTAVKPRYFRGRLCHTEARG